MPLLCLCKFPGCRKPVPRGEGYCPLHKAKGEEREAKANAERMKRRAEAKGSAAERGYGYRWRKLRARFLADHPLCEECLRAGRAVAATDVDHIIPHRGNPDLMWDEENLQALCHSCHSRKTASEDGGYGNTRK